MMVNAEATVTLVHEEYRPKMHSQFIIPAFQMLEFCV